MTGKVDAKSKIAQKTESKSHRLHYLWFVTVSVAVVAFMYGGNKVSDLSKFKTAFTENLCQSLMEKSPVAESADDGEELNDSVVSVSAKRVPSKGSFLNKKARYDAKQAMQARADHLTHVCHKFADIMVPTFVLRQTLPDKNNFAFYPQERVSFCPIPGIASEVIRSFSHKGDAGAGNAELYTGFYSNFPILLKGAKRVILVRHPLERIVSTYRCVQQLTLRKYVTVIAIL